MIKKIVIKNCDQCPKSKKRLDNKGTVLGHSIRCDTLEREVHFDSKDDLSINDFKIPSDCPLDDEN